MKNISLKRSFSKSKQSNESNIVTLSSIAKDIKDTKRDINKIHTMIEIQTEIMEGILDVLNRQEVNIVPKILIN